MKYSFAIICNLILMSFYSNSIAQNSSLPVPLNIQKAIEKGTRTLEGKPGPA